MRPAAFVVSSVLDRGDRDLADVGASWVVALGAIDPLELESSQDVVARCGLTTEFAQQSARGVWLDPLFGQQVEDHADHVGISIVEHGLPSEAQGDRIDVAVLSERELDLLLLRPRLLHRSASVFGGASAPHG